ncbi:MAG: hypothetical protein CMN94_11720 [Synechococcus sp. EAC657]|nr:hypothetical protein [Synechococcus sp. EAC657]
MDLNKAIEIDPNNVRAYQNRAITHDRNGNITDSCKDLKKGSSLGNESATRILENAKTRGLCK